MLRSKFGHLALVLSLALTGLGFTSAHAYPPGQKISVSLTQSMVKAGGTVTVNVSKAKPGNVVISLNSRKVTRVAGSDRLASRDVAPAKPGVYTVAVMDTATVENKTSTKLYVPSVSTPGSARVGVRTYVTVLYAKPGASVRVSFGSGSSTGTVGKNSKAVISIDTSRLAKGANNVTVTVGTLQFTKSITGK